MPTYAQTQRGYDNMWRAARIRPEWRGRVDAAAAKVRAGRQRYEAVASRVGCPWQIVGAIDSLESGCNPRTHLHNGDPLTRRTTRVPRGRPVAAPANGRAYTWQESAEDALRLKAWQTVRAWEVSRRLYEAERYNGWGYVARGVNSPYLWSGTTLSQRGKYVRDGVFDRNAESQQVGVVAILMALNEGSNGDMNDLKDYLLQFGGIAPHLAEALLGPKQALALKAVIEATGKDDATAESIKGLPIKTLLEVLREADEVVATVTASREQAPMQLAVEPAPKPEATAFDTMFGGERFVGWKTYIAIGGAVIVNVLAGLHFLPGVLTPENVTAINVALGGLGGASIVSKIERYTKYLAMLRLR